MSETRKRVYVAGPLTPTGAWHDNPAVEYLGNVRMLVTNAVMLIDDGFAPYCPALDLQYFLSTAFPLDLEDVKATSLSFLETCSAVLLCGAWEESQGTLAEIELAGKLGIPVYTDYDLMVSKLKEEK